MKLKLPIYILILITLFTILCSHEFWLQPNKYIYKRGEDINIRFLVGENFQGENWSGDSSRIKSLTYYFGGAKDDNLSKLFAGEGDSLKVKQYDEGTAMVTYNSQNAYITLDSSDFNDYLIDEGLTDELEYRKQHDELNKEGHELYQRSIKTIFQVGSTKDETYRQSTSLPLDIIPLVHPYKLKTNDALSILILFQNQPLVNAKVKVWNRYEGETVKEELFTDEKGMITFPILAKGKWMISCVKMLRLENDLQAEWQSYWGSCTWGYY